MTEENLISIYKDFIDYSLNQHTQIIRANLLFDRHLFHLLTTQANNNSNRLRRPRTTQTDRNRMFSLFIPNNNTTTTPISSSTTNNSNRLSLDFIQQNTTTNVFNRLENTINTTCPITRNEFTEDSIVTQINGCKHCFETVSINHWFLRGNTTCPTCRYDLVNDQPNDSSSEPALNNSTDISNNEDINTNTNINNNMTVNDNNTFEAEITSILLNPNLTSSINNNTNANNNLNNLTRSLFNIATEFNNNTFSDNN